MLYKFVEGYTAKNTAKNRCIALYTDTRSVTALQVTPNEPVFIQTYI